MQVNLNLDRLGDYAACVAGRVHQIRVQVQAQEEQRFVKRQGSGEKMRKRRWWRRKQ